MFCSLFGSRWLVATCLASLCGCSALPFQANERDALADLPPVEEVGWQERLARLKERGGRSERPAEERESRERTASGTKRGKKPATLLDERIASTTRREKAPVHKPAERDLTLGRWVKSSGDSGRMRTYDVERPDDSEPEVLARVAPRKKPVERPVSYDAPERTAAAESIAEKTPRELPPIVQPRAPVVNATPRGTRRTDKAEVAIRKAAPAKIEANEDAQPTSDAALPDNRLRAPRVAATTPVRSAEPAFSKSVEPTADNDADAVPWESATFRSVDE